MKVQKRLSLPGFRQAVITAGLLAATAGGFALWRESRPRSIGVCVVTDYSFRDARPNWREHLAREFVAANRIFGGTGVRWNFRIAEEPDPTGPIDDIEERRQKLARAQCEADVILGVTGRPGAMANVPPFAHTAIVPDRAAESEARNALQFAQALATLFGAPAEKKGSGALTARPPEGEAIPEPARKLIGRLRGYDFAAGAQALEAAWRTRAYDALKTAYESYGSNPARDARRVIGMSLAADGRYAAAVTELAEAVRLDPSNTKSHIDLATAYARNFQSRDATAEYRAAVRLAPGNAQAHAALAIALANEGLGDDAIDEFREAVRLEPKFASAQAGLAYVLAQQTGRIDDAIAAYRIALDMDSALPAAVNGLERANALKQRALAEAAEDRRKAEASPGNASDQFDLALSEARCGNLDAAVKAMRRAVELNGGNGLAREQLALLLYRQGDYAGSLQQAQEASRLGYPPPRDVADRLKQHAGK